MMLMVRSSSSLVPDSSFFFTCSQAAIRGYKKSYLDEMEAGKPIHPAQLTLSLPMKMANRVLRPC